MLNTRNTTFWIMVAASAGLWLAMLFVGGPDSGADVALYRALHVGERPSFADAAIVITNLGGWIALSALMVIAAIALAVRKRRMRAALLLILAMSGRFAVELQKVVVGRDRPDLLPHLVSGETATFPSAHAANALMVLLAIALLMPLGRGWRATAVTAALLLAFLIGLSRVALGVHWPTDVVGGWAFGLLWLLFFTRLASARPETAAEPDAPRFEAKEMVMIDNDRAESARRHDDSDIIDNSQDAPSHSGTSGGNLQRDVASQAEEERATGKSGGVTRVTGEDKPNDGDVPTLPNRD